MACLRAGGFGGKYQCSKCQENPSLRAAWGCVERAQLGEPYLPVDVDDGGTELILARCPVRYVPKSVIEFVQEYAYRQRFPASVKEQRNELNTLYLEAEGYYDRWHAQFDRDARETGNR